MAEAFVETTHVVNLQLSVDEADYLRGLTQYTPFGFDEPIPDAKKREAIFCALKEALTEI